MRVLIVHGYTASPASNWFPWLSSALAAEGACVMVPQMPDTHSPKADSWVETLRGVLPLVDESTLLVGHSLGCVALLRFLETMPRNTRVGGYVLVSGFDCELDTLPELAEFTAVALDYERLRKCARRRVSILSSDDSIVVPRASRELAMALDADLEEVASGGHFLDREGFTSLPVVYSALRRMARGVT